jgi:hypothetical protein
MASTELPPVAAAAALRQVESLGARMYRHDNAAAVATDAALALPAFRQDRRVRGWVTEDIPTGVAVTFTNDTPAALYRVEISKAGKPAGSVIAFEGKRSGNHRLSS